MNIAQVENNVKSLIDRLAAGNVPAEDFIYELLLAYGHRASTVSMLRNGHYNIAKDPDEIIFKRHLYFKQMQGSALHAEIDRMKNQKLVATNRTRFVVCTNFDHLLAVDTKTGDSLDIALAELPRKFDFFLPWAGMEKAVYQGENPADVKAAEKMAKLFDLIKADNFNEERSGDKAALHNLNVFLTRLLFCFFAEDTEIFADNQFSNAIQGHTSEDGSDLAEYLDRLFTVLNTPEKERGALPDYLSSFPYVNGGLFADNIPSPGFSRKSRRMLIECGSELNWSDINPDIFGSMIQAVVHPDQRGGMGMHYTSVTNIMKVIEPLFLNDLYEELDKASNSATKLQKLQQRLGEIKIFDPACGSGNFLIIAYKEIRRLEMELLKRWQELELEKTGQVLQAYSVIKLSQFYGMELDDFAHEVAILSLWLAEHQMNLEFRVEFGEVIPSLPLTKGGNITCCNSLQVDWENICPNEGETFVLGNPPYRGKKEQTQPQKSDLTLVCGHLSSYKILDFIACWFIKASAFISKRNGSCAFVSTNSITQGEQVGVIWPAIYSFGIEITFAYTSFMWRNNAKKNAGVAVVIIGFAPTGKSNSKKLHITNGDEQIVRNAHKINPYLSIGTEVVIKKRKKPISKISEIANGSMPNDDGNFFLDGSEFRALPQRLARFYKKAIGAREFFHSIERYCLWLDESNLDDALSNNEIKEIVNRVKIYRESSPRENTRKLASIPYRFGEVRFKTGPAMIVPGLSAESREYIPIGFVDDKYVVTNLAQVVYSAEPWLFSLISSKINVAWVKATSGYFKKDIRYSPLLSYNNMPFPKVSEQTKELMKESAFKILQEREKYSDRTIAELYNPKRMPLSLRAAHQENDHLIDQIYSKKTLNSDEERLEALFSLYEKMTGGQNA